MARATAIVRQLLVCAMAMGTRGALAASVDPAPGTAPATPAAAAVAQNLVKDGPEFEIDLTAPDVTTCFVFPEERRDEASCAGLDTSALKASFERVDRTHLVAAAVLHNEQSETMVTVINTSIEMSKITEANVQKTANEVLKGMAKSTAGGVPTTLAQPARLFQVGALQVLHLRVDVHPLKDAADVGVISDSYLVLSAGSTRMVQFGTMLPSLPSMQPVMERLIQGVRGKPTQQTSSYNAESIGYAIGYATGAFALPLFLVVALVVGGTIAVRRAKRREANSSDTPPNPN